MTRPYYMPEPRPDTRSFPRVTPLNTDWEALTATEAPRIPWDVFAPQLTWRQGEHVGLIGPTGQGKTTLLMALLPMRTYVTVLATKPYDPVMDELIHAGGYVKFDRWPTVPPARAPRRIIWPDATNIDAEDTQKTVFRDTYAHVYRRGGWTLVVDEGYIMADVLGLKKEMRAMWTQGRSLNISHVVATQRPAWVPVEMYDSTTHLFFWKTAEERALKRLSDLGAANAILVKYIVQRLEKFQCLYINTRTGKMARTRAPAPQQSIPTVKNRR